MDRAVIASWTVARKVVSTSGLRRNALAPASAVSSDKQSREGLLSANKQIVSSSKLRHNVPASLGFVARRRRSLRVSDF